MVGIELKTVTNKKEWEDFLGRHPESNFLQSWAWGEFHEGLGKKIKRVGFYEGKKLVGVMLSVVEKAKRGKYLTVPGGPIINWADERLVEKFVGQIKKTAKDESCVFVRVRPQLRADEFSRNLFIKYGFRVAPMHLHAELTLQLDVNKTEEELLMAMRKATRYEIRKAEKLNVKINTTTDSEAIKEFYELQIKTAQRQKFVPFSFEFLKSQFEAFAKEDKVILYRAQLDGKLLAQAFVIFYGAEAVYHYGASTDEGRKYPGAYLIQWEAIREAKKRGMERYNFWGIAPEGAVNHRFHGVSMFKRGFGGEEVEYLHAQDLVIDRLRYFPNLLIETLRNKMRGLAS